MDETLTLKTDERGRVTVPSRIREYLGVEDGEDVWVKITIHGLDPGKHPDKSNLGHGDDRGDA
jgi:bifunctional DNA-binding transcriptional regulator/antitoxin component of YhaV-PrlF toxin-antitoxin module